MSNPMPSRSSPISSLRGLLALVAASALLVQGCASGGDDSMETGGNASGGSKGDGGSGGGISLGGGGGKSDPAQCGDSLDLEGCSCQAGAAPRACYPGAATQAGNGICTMGTQSCTNANGGEIGLGVWAPCTGAGKPRTCAEVGASCGPADDGCGGQLDCGACPDCTAGSQTFSTPGTFDFDVPAFDTLTVEVWGAGGGADAGYGTDGKATAGGSSSFNATVVAGGGAAGTPSVPSAAGGTATGGATNLSGGAGGTGCYQFMVLCGAGSGGDAPPPNAGGKGGQKIIALDGCYTSPGGDGEDGQAPGGGGHGAWSCQQDWPVGQGWGYGGAAGGGGAYAKKVYSKGELASGKVSVVVGAGGIGAKGPPSSYSSGQGGKNPGYYTGGSGGAGLIQVTWTCK